MKKIFRLFFPVLTFAILSVVQSCNVLDSDDNDDEALMQAYLLALSKSSAKNSDETSNLSETSDSNSSTNSENSGEASEDENSNPLKVKFNQDCAVFVAPYNQPVEISCAAEISGDSKGSFSYQWYESADETTSSGKAIEGATSETLTVPATTEKGFRYYYCAATFLPSSENASNAESASAVSDIATVACTGLATVVIDTVDNEEPYGEGKDCTVGGGNYGYALINTTKVPGRMKIFKYGKTDAVYDSGDYVKKESGLTIKLRGNTSAGVDESGPLNEKHPYKIKLQKKDDLLADLVGRSGKKYKDKDWILLKDGTSLNTFVGLSVADIAGTAWTPEFAYVNLVLNGNYRGIYMLIESISQSEKRVNVADDGYVIERDAYWWNEDVYLKTALDQKYTFKYPDSDDIDEQLEVIKKYMKLVEVSVQDGTYDKYIDYESFARWQLIHDALGTWDSAGSNIYLTKYDSTSPDKNSTWTKLAMSTPWDFDSIYSMTNTWANNHGGTRLYENYLFSSDNKSFLDSYKSQWEKLSPVLWTELSTKLSELNTNYGEDINLSRKLDALRWDSSNYSTVENNINTAETWFSSRISWLSSAIGAL